MVFALGVEPRQGNATARPWFLLDCDGPDAEHPRCEGQQGMLEVWGALGSRASILIDVDSDGDLDIVTNEFNGPPLVLFSNLTERRAVRYIEIVLEGTKSNRDGLGAVVAVSAGGRTTTQVRDGKSGYLSQSLLPLYFGLDVAAAVDQIEVRWPSGVVQTMAGPLAANQRIAIVEP